MCPYTTKLFKKNVDFYVSNHPISAKNVLSVAYLDYLRFQFLRESRTLQEVLRHAIALVGGLAHRYCWTAF